MNIFVCVKQVPDTETKVTPIKDGSFIETNAIKWVMNPYDEFAVEQALQIKTKIPEANIIVVRLGKTRDTEALRTAMAMGADEAILIEAEDNLDSYMIAKALKGAILKSGKKADLILTGKQAIDDDCLQVPSLLAQMMDIPSVCVVVGFDLNGITLTLKREIEGGAVEIYNSNLPCLVSCQKGLNTPRYASLPGIMKAKKKPLAQYSLSDVGVSEADRRLKYSSFQLPPEKPPGKKFQAMEDGTQKGVVTQVVGLLRNEAKII